jgi:hypothetical protein
MSNYPRTSNKELNKLLKAASKQNWRFKPPGNGGHVVCYSPDGKNIVTVSSSTKSRRGVQNARADFRKAGVMGL